MHIYVTPPPQRRTTILQATSQRTYEPALSRLRCIIIDRKTVMPIQEPITVATRRIATVRRHAAWTWPAAIVAMRMTLVTGRSITEAGVPGNRVDLGRVDMILRDDNMAIETDHQFRQQVLLVIFRTLQNTWHLDVVHLLA
ncbi:unnamed protein product [Acanthoscelides obtectus]|uniref:Uncharacterized protein n=1 Tax=Acanthoscelides obtectus TaxID=200917 RepID=A0A9P0P9L4_ACAOB|nr:unnamed protein product [Acanthoscelides obtectus]CAK1655825.1 hypothetical protein AOBTE_LOCUS19368 [Acanthoscelides obtectus]